MGDSLQNNRARIVEGNFDGNPVIDMGAHQSQGNGRTAISMYQLACSTMGTLRLHFGMIAL